MGLELSKKEIRKGAFQITLTGTLDTQTYDQFEKAASEILPRAIAIIVDLSGLTYVSSMGLRALARIRKSMKENNNSFILVNPQPHVKLVFDVTNIFSDSLLASLDQADELLDSFLDKVQKGEIKPRLPKSL